MSRQPQHCRRGVLDSSAPPAPSKCSSQQEECFHWERGTGRRKALGSLLDSMSSRRDSERGGAEGDESMFGRGQGGLRIEG